MTEFTVACMLRARTMEMVINKRDISQTIQTFPGPHSLYFIKRFSRTHIQINIYTSLSLNPYLMMPIECRILICCGNGYTNTNVFHTCSPIPIPILYAIAIDILQRYSMIEN